MSKRHGNERTTLNMKIQRLGATWMVRNAPQSIQYPNICFVLQNFYITSGFPVTPKASSTSSNLQHHRGGNKGKLHVDFTALWTFYSPPIC